MSIPTVAVTCIAYDQNGNPVIGGLFRARLNRTETYNGFVVPEQVTGIADANGVCILQLWPNALGVASSSYRINAINPDTGQQYLNTTAVVPNSACNLHEIIVAAPFPPVSASEQALTAAQGALASVTAQAGIATAAANNAEDFADDAEDFAVAAQASAVNASASFTDFDKRYLGTKSSDPIVDNEGNALQIGALYYLVDSSMRIYDGNIWSAAYISESGTLTTSDIGATIQAQSENLNDFAAKTAPAGVIVGTTDTQTLTNKSISGSANTLTNIANASLVNQSVTVNGQTVALGASTTVTATATNPLTIGTGLNGASYNGSAPVTVSLANTAVTPGAYGSASNTLSATANAQGQLTALAATAIAITNTQVSGLGTMSTQNANTVAITGGTATLTSLTVDDNTTLGSSNTDDVVFNARIASEFTPATDNAYDLGSSGREWRDLFIDGTANIDSLVADTADINGGTIDATSVGATTPSTGSFTNLSASGTLGVTGVATLGVGAVLNTPASVTLTNATGLPISTGVSGLGTGVATFLTTPSSANLAAAVTDETGTGALVFATSPTLVTPALGTPASGVVTNLTGTASININGTVGATTASTGAFTNLAYTGTLTGGTGVVNLGSGQLVKDASGNVGIGAPAVLFGGGQTTLQVTGNNANFPARGGIFRSTTFDGNCQAFYGVRGDNRPSIGSITNHHFALFTNNTERMRIDSAGNVLIGVSSSQSGSKSVVQGSIALQAVANPGDAFPDLQFYNNNSTGFVNASISATVGTTINSGNILFNTNSSGSFAERMRISQNGNVGIGTSSPDARLNISSAAVGTGSGEVAFKMSVPANIVSAQNEIRSGVTSGTNPYMSFAVRQAVDPFATVERLRITSAGNVGIGTSSPDSGGLHINSGLGYLTLERSGTGFDGKFRLVAGGLNDGGFRIQDGTTDRLAIDSTGNVGIGTSSPSLVGFGSGTGGVQVTNATNAGIRINGNAGGDFFLVSGSGRHFLFGTGAVPMTFATDGSERMRIDSNGNVGIGVTAPGDKLEIGGAGAGIILASPNGTRYRITVNDAGVITAAAV